MEKYTGLNKGQTRAKLKEIKDTQQGLLSPTQFEWVKGAFEFLMLGHLSAKIGGRQLVGIAVNKSPTFSSKCFYLVFSDGTRTDISYKGARSSENDLIWALRDTVMPTIWAFKKKADFPIRCPITGELISWEDSDVDHYDLTFSELVSHFIERKGGINNLLPFITESTDNSDKTLIVDENLKREFIAFHNAHTHLRIVSKIANRSILKKKDAKGTQLTLF